MLFTAKEGITAAGDPGTREMQIKNKKIKMWTVTPAQVPVNMKVV